VVKVKVKIPEALYISLVAVVSHLTRLHTLFDYKKTRVETLIKSSKVLQGSIHSL
jgi:hypothetical protein